MVEPTRHYAKRSEADPGANAGLFHFHVTGGTGRGKLLFDRSEVSVVPGGKVLESLCTTSYLWLTTLCHAIPE